MRIVVFKYKEPIMKKPKDLFCSSSALNETK